MVIARFEFLPEHADQFVWSAGQQVVEMTFDNIFDLIRVCQEHEDVIKDCTVLVDGHIINLQALSI